MKRTPLRKVSRKRAAQNSKYSREKKRFLEAFVSCRICWNNGQFTPARDVHHMAGRIGEKLLDKADWLPVCRGCHSMIHDDPKWARANGYLK
jgi:hypothetical protein